jgi:hypothetical protein
MAYALTLAGARLNIGTSSSLAFDKDSTFTVAGNYLFPTLSSGAFQLINKQDNAGNATGWALAFLWQLDVGQGVGNWISFSKRNNSTNDSLGIASASPVAGQWSHMAASTTSANTLDQKFYFNGSQLSTVVNRNTLTSGITNAVVPQINGRNGANNLSSFQAAEVGIWNAALTAAEIASLAKGMTCDKVRPQSLVFYAPLVRDLQDARGGLAITNNNGATVANHPRVYA